MLDSHSLLHVGTECSHPSCNQVDFLPILCRCEKKFCSEHYKPEDHDCPVKPTEAKIDQLQPTLNAAKRCALPNCQNLALNAFNESAPPTCSKCQLSFCAQHRYSDSHGCSPPTTPGPRKNEDARNLLVKHFPKKKTSISKPNSKSQKPPTAQQRKIELMKMRHHAKPGDSRDQAVSLPVDQRVHVKVKAGDVENVYWFRKNLSTGKVLDCLARHFNLPTAQPLRIFLKGIPLQNESLFAEEIDDGDTVLIEQVLQP